MSLLNASVDELVKTCNLELRATKY